MAFSIVMEGYWDKKMKILERVMFAVAAVLLLTPDSAFDMESYLGAIQNTHVIGFVIFAVSMAFTNVIKEDEFLCKS